MTTPRIERRGDRVEIDVRVAPRASRDAVLGVHDGALKIALTAPPVDGEANAALTAFVAKRLGVPKGAVVVARGEKSKQKTLAVVGIDEATVRDRLLGRESAGGA